jgi:cell wall-associated NlpC family hydrolase
MLVLMLAVVGCGVRQPVHSATATRRAPTTTGATVPALPRAHPQVVEPTAGAAAGVSQAAASPEAPAAVSVGPSSGELPQPASTATIRRELAASGMSANPNEATLTSDGLAIAPIGAPPAVQEIIAAGNQIARLPYRYGGGHATYADTAYDCSGSISYVFGAAHLLSGSMTSGGLMNWGDPGPGKWISVYANAGHTFMYIAGLRFDTVALAETGTRWSNRRADEGDLASFAVRHPPGL